MDATTATNLINDFKAAELEITVRLTDGTEVYGMPISVNSKGVNVKVDGKTKSIALSRIDAIFNDADEDLDAEEIADLDELEADDHDEDPELTDEEIYAQLGDGMTTAELAAHLSDALETELTPKELRVHLRALGLGVGKGRKYSLSATEFRMVRDLVKASA